MSTSEESAPAAKGQGVPVERSLDYLEREINLFKPATPFMRANLRMIFALVGLWILFVFGPVTASYFFPEVMTETRILGGFPLNFFLTAMVAPAAALILAGIYAAYRDRLDRQFNADLYAKKEADGGDDV